MYNYLENQRSEIETLQLYARSNMLWCQIIVFHKLPWSRNVSSPKPLQEKRALKIAK
jgi:hypothetical protein